MKPSSPIRPPIPAWGIALTLLASLPAAEPIPVLPLARAAAVSAADERADVLDRPVPRFRADRSPVGAAFLALGHSYGLTFVLEPGLRGEVTLEARDRTLRETIDAVAGCLGLCWERRGRTVTVRRSIMRCYEIDYPQMTRSAQGASSVVLSAQPAAAYPAGAPVAAAVPLLPSGGSDQTSVSIQQQNQTTFWGDVQAELAALAQPGETVAVNRLAGLAVVTAPPARQEDFARLIETVNRRIARQVRISARVLEVSLDSSRALGVDWALAARKAGGLRLSGVGTATALSDLGGRPLGPGTVSGTVATSGVSAVVEALREQGEVRAVSNPSVVSLSNQTAFVKVGTEQTFFSRSSSTTVSQAGAAAPFSATQSAYVQNAITIGTVLYVTPQVNRDGTVTVDVLPAVTQLIGIDASPDGQQTAPRMDIKSLSTIARLRSGESILIGGLIRDEKDRRTRSVPLLGDLPLLGRAFGTSASSSARSELVIFLSAEPVA